MYVDSGIFSNTDCRSINFRDISSAEIKIFEGLFMSDSKEKS